MDSINCWKIIGDINIEKEISEGLLNEFWNNFNHKNTSAQLSIEKTPKTLRKKLTARRRLSKIDLTSESYNEDTDQTFKRDTRYNLRTRNQHITNSFVNEHHKDTKKDKDYLDISKTNFLLGNDSTTNSSVHLRTIVKDKEESGEDSYMKLLNDNSNCFLNDLQNDTKNGGDNLEASNINNTLIVNAYNRRAGTYCLRPKTNVKYVDESFEECSQNLKKNNKNKKNTDKQKGTKSNIIIDDLQLSKTDVDIPLDIKKVHNDLQNIRKRKSDHFRQPIVKLSRIEDIAKESILKKPLIQPSTPIFPRIQPTLSLKLSNTFALNNLQNKGNLLNSVNINNMEAQTTILKNEQKKFFNSPDISENPEGAYECVGNLVKKKSDDGYSTCSTNTDQCNNFKPNVVDNSSDMTIVSNIYKTPSKNNKNSPLTILTNTLKKFKIPSKNNPNDTTGIVNLRFEHSDIESSPKQDIDNEIVNTVFNMKTVNNMKSKKLTPSTSSVDSQNKISAVTKLCSTVRSRFNTNKKIIQRTPSTNSLKSLNRTPSSSSSTDSMNLPKPVSYIQKYQKGSASKNDLYEDERVHRYQEEERKINLARMRKEEAIKKKAEEVKLKNEKKLALIESEKIRREEEERLKAIEEKALYDKKMDAIAQAKAQKQLEKDLKKQKKQEKELQAKERRDEEERKKQAELELRRLKEEQETKRIQQQKEAELKEKAEKAAETKKLQELKRVELEEKNRQETERLRILEEKRIEMEKQREKEKKEREKKDKEELEQARLEKYRIERQRRLQAEQEARDRAIEAEKNRRLEEELAQREQKRKEAIEAKELAMNREKHRNAELATKERILEMQRRERLEFEARELEAKERAIELEKQKKIEHEVKERAKEMEKQKKIEHEARERAQEQAKIEQKWKEEEALKLRINQQKELKAQIDEYNFKTKTNSEALSKFTIPSKPANNIVYKIPLKSKPGENVTPKAQNYKNYNIDDLQEDESDDENQPKKRIPLWAEMGNVKILVQRGIQNEAFFRSLFPAIQDPDLNVIFDNSKRDFKKRTSSANWDTPPKIQRYDL